MTVVYVWPQESGEWEISLYNGRSRNTAIISHEAFLGLVQQLVACGLFHIGTEAHCDVPDGRVPDEAFNPDEEPNDVAE